MELETVASFLVLPNLNPDSYIAVVNINYIFSNNILFVHTIGKKVKITESHGQVNRVEKNTEATKLK